MMMSQSYYCGDYDPYSRPSHRVSTTSRYDRSVPYTHGYYEFPNHELRSDYAGTSGSRTVIQEQSPEHGPPGHARRRIQVACSRCRRRKIKCTGDPGDGSGCSACRSAGAGRDACTFMRVGSEVLPVVGIDMISSDGGAPATTSTSATYSIEATSSPYDSGIYHTHHRSSLPMLQTRTAYPEYESYGASPLDEYSYGPTAFSRQPSVSSTYGAENFRPWTSGSISAPVTSTSLYYEPAAAFSFGTLQANGPFPSTPMGRLPSVANEAFTPLNMGSLHYSLPTQTVQERRLPVPHAQGQQQTAYQGTNFPQIRPLGSYPEQTRDHVHGVHTRNGMTWSAEDSSTQPVLRSSSMSSRASRRVSGLAASSGSSVSSLTGEPILGYQFSSSSGSPDVSPDSGTTPSENHSSSSTSATSNMLPPPSCNIRASSLSGSVSSLNTDRDETPRPPSSARVNTNSLYSFSTGAETPGRIFSDPHGVQSNPAESRRSSTTPRQSQQPTLRHPQPQHAASVDELRRRSSYDQRAATAHRMSVSNLNGRY